MSRRRQDILQEALEAAGRGQPVDPILAALSPDDAAEVRSLLAAATAAARLGGSPVPPDAARRSRLRLLRRAAAASPMAPRSRFATLLPRLSAAALVALLALGLGLGGLNEAAAHALPGDILYPVKLAAADLRLRLEFEAGQRLRLELLYAEQRLEDVRRLLALGRVVPVSFHGQVQSIGPVVWEVQDIPVRLSSSTRVLGGILAGMQVEIRGSTQTDGTILADEVRLESFDTLGTLEALDAGQITVDGQAFLLTPRSYLEPGLTIGQRVLVRVAIGDAGRRTVVSAIQFSPPTPTEAPPATAMNVPTHTSPPPATPTAEAEPTDDENGSGGETPGPGDEHEGETKTTATAEPTDDDEGEQEKIDFTGVVQSIDGSQWVVDGRTIRVDGATEVRGDPQEGDTVKVVAFRQSDGSWWAEKVEVDD